MGEREEVGWDDWDKIVKVKEESLIVINANKRNIEVGEIIENLVLKRAIKERNKYPKPQLDTMPEEDKEEDKEEDTEDEEDSNL